MIFLFLNPINIKRLGFFNLNNDDTAEKRGPMPHLLASSVKAKSNLVFYLGERNMFGENSVATLEHIVHA